MVYFKFFPRNLILKGFQYKLGNNKDIHPFDSSNRCKVGGLYYTDIENIHKFEEYGKMIGIIEIPSNIPIVKIEDKYKSPEINIIDLFEYEEFLSREDLYLKEKKKIDEVDFIIKMPYLQTTEICKKAVKNNDLNLKYVCSQFKTTEICMIAVKKCGFNLRYVAHELQTVEMAMEAVNQNGFYLKYVAKHLQRKQMCEIAVKQHPSNLEFVKPELQTFDLGMLAVKQVYLQLV